MPGSFCATRPFMPVQVRPAAEESDLPMVNRTESHHVWRAFITESRNGLLHEQHAAQIPHGLPGDKSVLGINIVRQARIRQYRHVLMPGTKLLARRKGLRLKTQRNQDGLLGLFPTKGILRHAWPATSFFGQRTLNRKSSSLSDIICLPAKTLKFARNLCAAIVAILRQHPKARLPNLRRNTKSRIEQPHTSSTIMLTVNEFKNITMHGVRKSTCSMLNR